MNAQYKNLIEQIKKMINDPEQIYIITLSNGRDCHNREGDKKPDYVKLSHDKTKIVCQLLEDDSLDIMVDKIMKAESLLDECLSFKRYKQNSPYLSESLYYNIPELKNNCIY